MIRSRYSQGKRPIWQNAHNLQTRIAFIHGVISLAALGGIIPKVSTDTACSGLRFGSRDARPYACFASGTAMAEKIEPYRESAAELIVRALTNDDEQVIKFTVAYLRRNTVRQSPAYPAAVANVVDAIPRR